MVLLLNTTERVLWPYRAVPAAHRDPNLSGIANLPHQIVKRLKDLHSESDAERDSDGNDPTYEQQSSESETEEDHEEVDPSGSP